VKTYEVREHVRDLLMASPLVSQFGPILLVDGKPHEQTKRAALEARGAFIAIDQQQGGEGALIQGGKSVEIVGITIGVYEIDSVPHSPAGDLLEYHVKAALLAGQYTKQISSVKAISEGPDDLNLIQCDVIATIDAFRAAS
jgi:hypothetical protein